MTRFSKTFALGIVAVFPVALPAVAQMGGQSVSSQVQLDKIKLPAGFKIEVYAQVPEARSMAVVPELNAVFVGNRRGDKVYVVVDADQDGAADEVKPIASGLKSPNGIAWHQGYLYIAEQNRVIRIPAPDLKSIDGAKREIVLDGLPDKSHHGWRYIGFDPKGQLYVTIGSPCNICTPEGLEGKIVRVDNGKPRIVASGHRNSVGMDWHPKTGQMYFTDNGADNMGDDVPPDELNMLTVEGQDFGFPSYGGGESKTKEFGAKATNDMVQPVVKFGAHVAALGLTFYRGSAFPQDYRTDAFVAQHGSWNRSTPDGYRVMRIKMEADGKVIGVEPFAEGWLQGRSAWGRPVDVKELKDGSLLVSDDAGGRIYRISYGK
jgi:glucose/arabinose dehydrogenase